MTPYMACAWRLFGKEKEKSKSEIQGDFEKVHGFYMRGNKNGRFSNSLWEDMHYHRGKMRKERRFGKIKEDMAAIEIWRGVSFFRGYAWPWEENKDSNEI